MLANIICWILALALIFSNPTATFDFTTKLLFAMGFIFLGILSKAVDTYRMTHTSSKEATKEKNSETSKSDSIV